jgi:hypothetical protein
VARQKGKERYRVDLALMLDKKRKIVAIGVIIILALVLVVRLRDVIPNILPDTRPVVEFTGTAVTVSTYYNSYYYEVVIDTILNGTQIFLGQSIGVMWSPSSLGQRDTGINLYQHVSVHGRYGVGTSFPDSGPTAYIVKSDDFIMRIS